MEDDQVKNTGAASQQAEEKQPMALIDEATIRKMEIARLEKKAAKKKKKQAKKEKEKVMGNARDDTKLVKAQFDLEKFRIVLERLQLNWIKWNVTSITIGFAAYKFYYTRMHDEKSPVTYTINGRDIGLFLITLGTVSLLFATIQHKRNVDKLKKHYDQMPYSLTLRLAYIIIPFAFFILLLVILRT